MTVKKRKPKLPTPDLTVDAGAGLVVFSDKPRGGVKRRSPGVLTSYDPAVEALAKEISSKPLQTEHLTVMSNGHSKQDTQTERQHLDNLELLLTDCLTVARELQSKRAAKILTLLGDVRSRVQQLRG